LSEILGIGFFPKRKVDGPERIDYFWTIEAMSELFWVRQDKTTKNKVVQEWTAAKHRR
jgi:hypothetical protein